jgi:hypothetical protein
VIPSSGTGNQGESAATTIIAFQPVQVKFVKIRRPQRRECAGVVDSVVAASGSSEMSRDWIQSHGHRDQRLSFCLKKNLLIS